jgi:uncharacterized FlaG/YvyC family protein
MDPSSIQPIGSVQQADNSAISKLTATVQSDTLAQHRPAIVRPEKPQPEVETAATQENSLENVSIHFRLDDKTNTVTIFLVDRKSKKVLRSIPASELQKMQIGDLLKLTI